MVANTRILIFSSLLLAYGAYSAKIYFSDGETAVPGSSVSSMAEGKILWQKYNCQSCHQLYGLGGYLGPDLTNCYSAPHKGPGYMDAILQYGTGIMPDFKLTPSERSKIIEYLKYVDNSGHADPKRFTTTVTGNIYPDAAE